MCDMFDFFNKHMNIVFVSQKCSETFSRDDSFIITGLIRPRFYKRAGKNVKYIQTAERSSRPSPRSTICYMALDAPANRVVRRERAYRH